MKETWKKIIEEYYKNNSKLGRAKIFETFFALGVPKSTLNRWLMCLESGKSLVRKKGSGRPVKVATKAKIQRRFNHRSGCSQRKVARELKTSQAYISYILKNHTSIRCRKKIKKPDMTEKQRLLARPKCRRLARIYADSEFILDDESYFTKSNSSLPGNDIYYSDNPKLTPNNVKHKKKAKYDGKLLVYLAISPRGYSKPIFFNSGLAINQFKYRDECLKESLIPFIRKYHSVDRYVFWPDLASSHYAKSVTSYLKTKKIPFVQKKLESCKLAKSSPNRRFLGNLETKSV